MHLNRPPSGEKKFKLSKNGNFYQVFRGQTTRLGQDQNHRLLESACRRRGRRWGRQKPLGGRPSPPPALLLRQHHSGRRQQPEGGEQPRMVGPGHPQQHVRDGQHVPPSCRTDQVVMGSVLRIRDVYPGSERLSSRIRIFSIPDPGSASKNLSTYFNPKNDFQALGNMIRVVHPGSGSWLFTHPGSRGSKRHRIPDPQQRMGFFAKQMMGKWWRRRKKFSCCGNSLRKSVKFRENGGID